MLWNKLCYLCSRPAEVDDYNRPTTGDWIKRKVYCDNSSVRQSEFYQAHANGFKPEIMIKTRSYHDETHIEFKGIMYRIMRTNKKGEVFELIGTTDVL